MVQLFFEDVGVCLDLIFIHSSISVESSERDKVCVWLILCARREGTVIIPSTVALAFLGCRLKTERTSTKKRKKNAQKPVLLFDQPLMNYNANRAGKRATELGSFKKQKDSPMRSTVSRLLSTYGHETSSSPRQRQHRELESKPRRPLDAACRRSERCPPSQRKPSQSAPALDHSCRVAKNLWCGGKDIVASNFLEGGKRGNVFSRRATKRILTKAPERKSSLTLCIASVGS